MALGQGRKTALCPHLTPGQREALALTQHVYSSTITPQLRLRARMVLLLAHGWTITAIARHIGLTRKCIYKWLWRWQAEGLPGLQDRKPGYAPRHTSTARRNHHDAV